MGVVARVESLDLLRGLCAISVAVYHVLGWLQLADLHDLGLYGVYLFFLLSGASMALAYANRLRGGYPVTKYLVQRYIRLAPLYVLVATYVGVVELRHLYTPIELGGRWLLNATFLFGFANPGETSLVTGGWSLGIEFVFYAVFPVLLVVVASRRGLWFALALLALQMVFVNLVLENTSLEHAWVAYTQFAAFVGYFAVGSWLGIAHLAGRFRVVSGGWWLIWVLVIALIATQSGSTTAASLVGFRGAALTIACCILLALTIQLTVPKPLRWLSSQLGSASYPMYLLHPVLFGLLSHPRLLGSMRSHHPESFAVAVIVASFVVALAVYRWIEEPVMRWAKVRITRWWPAVAERE